MGLSWSDVIQPVIAGLAAILGVHATEEVLRVLRRRGICPDRWARARTFLRPGVAFRRRPPVQSHDR
jgi:hypothetical protein